MNNIKIFRNMTGVNAANGLKNKISEKSWWIGVAGNILSTVMGIALTLGIASIVDHHKDRRQAREMMFSIVCSAEDNVKDIAKYDSLCHVEKVAALTILYSNIYGDLSKLPEDTLSTYLNECIRFVDFSSYGASLDNYFYSAQMMHQFSNPEIYSYFGAYVEYNKTVANEIKTLHDEAAKLYRTIMSRQIQKSITTHELVYSLIEDGTLSDYAAFLMNTNLSQKISGCQQMFENMLLQMNATKEEYEKYKAKNSIVDEERVLTLTEKGNK